MNPVLHAVRLGFARGWIEFKQSLASFQDTFWNVLIYGSLLVVLFFQRGSEVEGVSLAMLTLPSLLGLTVVLGGLSGAAGQLSFDREDGTLLRAKATPQGMVGYLVSRISLLFLTTLFGLILLLVPGSFIVSELWQVDIAGWLLFAALVVLGLMATIPWGAMLGSLVRSSGSGFGISFLASGGLAAISGIFYPITALAGWLQFVGQLFPAYWLGLGMRSVFLPDAAAAAEIGGSWRPGLMFLVVGAWAVAGLLLAPRVLRRMARRESGSDLERKKQEALTRGY